MVALSILFQYTGFAFYKKCFGVILYGVKPSTVNLPYLVHFKRLLSFIVF